MIQSFRRHDGLTCLTSSETFTKKRNMIDSPWYVQLLRPQIFILAVTLSVIPLESITAQTAEKKETLKTENQVTELQLRTQAAAALRTGDTKEAIAAANQLTKKFPQSPAAMLTAADTLLRCGKPAESLVHFDEYLKAEPNALPYLWQRGIAQYFAGRYQEGVKQFEVHRSVNPNDVENAAWHFLCLARADSFEKASSLVLPAPNDPRIPMEEVLKMLKSGDTSLVKNRINTVPESSGERARAEFYGFFYLGLFADAKGNQQEALQWLRKSAEDAPHHYMGDVARVYVQYLIRELDGNK